MEDAILIERPYGAEDNEWNIAQRELVQFYCKRHNEKIVKFRIWTYGVIAETESGRIIHVSRTWNGACLKKISTYLYMNEEINGKQIRIKKSEY